MIMMLTTACGPSQTDREVSRFAREFSAVPPDNPGAYQALLEKYRDRIPANHDGAELIRAKVLIALGRYPDADKKIEGILSRESDLDNHLDNQAWLAKVRIMIYTGKQDEALKAFRSIEKKSEAGKELASVRLYFALFGPDAGTRADYARKFLAAGNENPELYRAMAADARLDGDVTGARQHLNKALEISKDPVDRKRMEAELAKLDLVGKEAPALEADRWLNNLPPGYSGRKFKGRPVLLAFRAPWCGASRNLTQLLNEAYETGKTDGLSVIDCMKLYGFFRDDAGGSDTRSPQSLTPDEEVNLIREFLGSRGITWPAAINNEGIPLEDYHVTALPVLFFIDKQGKIRDFETGAGNPGRIKQKIARLTNME